MKWKVIFHEDFVPEFENYDRQLQLHVFASIEPLELLGPNLGRPHADTLKGSEFPNMKELRFKTDSGVWRLAYAFDRERSAILLVSGDKRGSSEKRFYKTLIAKADFRFSKHLAKLKRKH